jgi:hypothetical protein
LRNKDKYYYMGRCYGNCIDDQSNYYDYQITKKSQTQQFPGFAEDNPAYLPNLSDYLAVIAPNSMIGTVQNPGLSSLKCRIDKFGNFIDKNGTILAHNAKMDFDGNFIDSKGNILTCPTSFTPVSSPAITPVDDQSTLFTLTPALTPINTSTTSQALTPADAQSMPFALTPTLTPINATTGSPALTPSMNDITNVVPLSSTTISS